MPGKYSALPRRSLIAAACAIAAAALAIAPASILASCARKAAATSAAQAAPVAAPSPSPATGQLAPAQLQKALPKIPNPAKPLPRPTTPISPPLAASMRAFGLRATSVPRIGSDFSIGPLQSYRPAAGDEAAAFAVARSFADGVAAGKLDKTLLFPEARDALSVLLAPPPPDASAQAPGASAPVPYRLGMIILRGPDASLRLRLPGTAGSPRREGLLSLRKVEDTWYVEALSLDPPASGALAFNPDSSSGAEGRPR